MANMRSTLLNQIETDSLDPEADVAGALRKCVALGGQSGSEALRDWATRELKGYDGSADLPEYRKITGIVALDGIAGRFQVTGQQISPLTLPEPANTYITDEVHLRQPIAELVHLVAAAKAAGETGLKFGLPGGAELAALMNSRNTTSFQYIERLYWHVSVSSVASIVDVVRTNLVELVSEMQAGLTDGAAIPTKALADQAVSVAIHGNRNRVTLADINQSAPSGDLLIGSSQRPESWLRRMMWWLVAAATVVGAGATVVALFVAYG